MQISKSNVNQKINRETTIHWYDGAIGIALLVAIIILSITIIILLIICVCNNYLKKRKTNSESSYQMESSSSYPNRPVPPRPSPRNLIDGQAELCSSTQAEYESLHSSKCSYNGPPSPFGKQETHLRTTIV